MDQARIEQFEISNHLVSTCDPTNKQDHDYHLHKSRSFSDHQSKHNESLFYDDILREIISYLDQSLKRNTCMWISKQWFLVVVNDLVKNAKHNSPFKLIVNSHFPYTVSTIGESPFLNFVKVIEFQEGTLDREGFQAVCELKHLTKLTIRRNDIPAEAFRSISQLTQLKTLHIPFCNVRDSNLEVVQHEGTKSIIRAFANLTNLTLGEIGNEEARSISELENLLSIGWHGQSNLSEESRKLVSMGLQRNLLNLRNPVK